MASTLAKSEVSFEDRIATFQQNTKDEVKDILHGTGKLKALELIFGGLLVVAGIPIPGLGFAVNVGAAIVLIGLRLAKPSRYTVAKLNIFAAVFLLAMVYISVMSFTTGVSTPEQTLRRTIRFMVVVGLLFLIADHRVHFKSLMLGLGIGMIVNAVAFYAGVAPAYYGSALTGWLGDKNISGMYYGFVPIILFGLFHKRWQRVVILLIALPLLFETQSRTSMGGFILGILWILFAQRANLLLKMILGFFFGWIFDYMQTNFAHLSVFGDREGTDWFREQIDIAAWAKTEAAPWHGLGLGQATVVLENGQRQYFHNSFWTLLVEGGWPWAIAVLGLTFYAVFVWRQTNQVSASHRNMTAEAATVFLLICSWRLGEVILTIPWGIAIGYALSLTAVPKKTAAYMGVKSKIL